MSPAFLKILERVREVQRIAFRDGHRKLWFRGQRDAKWELRSKLHREVLRRRTLKENYLQELRGIEGSFHLRFRHTAWPLLSEDQRKPWGLLFAMQHYGVLTRFLDWTMSFACALHFAQRHRERTDDAVIFIIEPETANKHAIGDDVSFNMPLDLGVQHLVGEGERRADLDLYHPTVVPGEGEDISKLPSICVLAPLSNPRMAAQRGVFMLCGNLMEEAPYHLKIELPTDTYDDAEEFLVLAGVDEFTYFPDLPGLGQHLELGLLGSER